MSSRAPSDFWSKYVPPSQTKGEPNGGAPTASKNSQGNEIPPRSARGHSASRKTTLDAAPERRKIRTLSHELTATNSTVIPNRPVVLDALLRETRHSLLRAQKASRCLTAEKPDREYDVNKLKWCADLGQAARIACLFSDRDTESQTLSIRSRTVIEQFCEDLLHVFSGLFFRLTLLHRESATPRLDRLLIIDLCTVFLDMAKIGGRQERLWLEDFARLKELHNVSHDPQQSAEALHQMIEHCTGPQNVARYYLYLYLYEVAYEYYRIATKTANEAIEWKAIVIRLKESISPRMKDDFLSLSKFFAGKAHEGEKSMDDPAELITRHLHAKQFAEGHYALAQAHEAAANISISETAVRWDELEGALGLYLEAHDLLKPLDKEKAGLALAKVGLLRWRFCPTNERAAAIRFLRSAQEFEKYADQEAWWVTETKKYIAMYEEELMALEQERLRKEREERKREELRQKEDHEKRERVRYEAMLQNVEALKEDCEKIQMMDDLLTFSEQLLRDFAPPEVSAKEQLNLHILELRNRQGSKRICLKKIIRLYHPDKNGTQGDTWKLVCAEITKILNLVCETKGALLG